MAAKYVDKNKFEKTHKKKLSATEFDSLRQLSNEEIQKFLRDEYYYDPQQEKLLNEHLSKLRRNRSPSNDDLPPEPKVELRGGFFYIRFYDYLKNQTIKRSLGIRFREKGDHASYVLNGTDFWKTHPKAIELEIKVLEYYIRIITQRVYVRMFFDRVESNTSLLPELNKDSRNLADYLIAKMKYQTLFEEKKIVSLMHKLFYLTLKKRLEELKGKGYQVSKYETDYVPFDFSNYKSFSDQFIELASNRKLAAKLAKMKANRNANKKLYSAFQKGIDVGKKLVKEERKIYEEGL